MSFWTFHRHILVNKCVEVLISFSLWHWKNLEMICWQLMCIVILSLMSKMIFLNFCVCPCYSLYFISDLFNSLSLLSGSNICILVTYLSPVSKTVFAPDFCVVLHKFCHVIMWQYSYAQLQNPEEWPIIEPLPSYGRGRERLGGRHISLIHGDGLSNVVITGM